MRPTVTSVRSRRLARRAETRARRRSIYELALRTPVAMLAVLAIAALMFASGHHDFFALSALPIFGMAAGSPAVKIPAQRLTRVYWKKVPNSGAIFTMGGSNVSFDLLQEGWCPGLLLQVTGTITVANAGLVFLPRAPWNIFSKALVQPPGAQPVINVGGHPLHVANQIGQDFAPFTHNLELTMGGLDANAGSNDPINQFVTTVGAGKTVNLWYWVPFARSAYDWTGSLGLGNRSKTQLILTPETIANLVTVAANLTANALTVNLYQAIIAPFPKDASVVPWDTSKVYTLEEQNQAMVIGDNFVNIDPKNRIQRVWHEAWNTNVDATAQITGIDIAFDGSYFLNNFDTAAWYQIAKRRLGFAPFPGTIMVDYDYMLDADGASEKLLGGAFAVSKGSWFNTEKVAAVRHRLVKESGTALANNPKIFTVIQREASLVG